LFIDRIVMVFTVYGIIQKLKRRPPKHFLQIYSADTNTII